METEAVATRSIEIQKIRRDGETQCRVSLSRSVVDAYAGQISDGIVFPPVRVWYDGTDYWLSDGFHRLAAMEKLGHCHVLAEVRQGGLSDARWESCSSNQAHGLRRSTSDLIEAVRIALAHPNSKRMSNGQLARHLGMPETTLRRLINKMPERRGNLRVVSRRGTQYEMRVDTIGHYRKETGRPKAKSFQDVRRDISYMKLHASPDVSTILNIFSHWAFSSTPKETCLDALEAFVARRSYVLQHSGRSSLKSQPATMCSET